MVKQSKDNKQQTREPTYKTAEGKFESVGTQGGVCYIVVDGRRMNCDAGEIIKVEIKKK